MTSDNTKVPADGEIPDEPNGNLFNYAKEGKPQSVKERMRPVGFLEIDKQFIRAGGDMPRQKKDELQEETQTEPEAPDLDPEDPDALSDDGTEQVEGYIEPPAEKPRDPKEKSKTPEELQEEIESLLSAKRPSSPALMKPANKPRKFTTVEDLMARQLLSPDEQDEDPDTTTSSAIKFFSDMDSEEYEDWYIMLFRKLPEEIDNQPAAGLLERIPMPINFFELQDRISKKYGGGTYKILVFNDKRRLTRNKHLTLPGNPIQKRNTSTKPEGAEQSMSVENTKEYQDMKRALEQHRINEAVEIARARAKTEVAEKDLQGQNAAVDLAKTIINSMTKPAAEDGGMKDLIRVLNDKLDRMDRENQDLKTQMMANKGSEANNKLFELLIAVATKPTPNDLDKLLPIVLNNKLAENKLVELLLNDKISGSKNSNPDEMVKRSTDLLFSTMQKIINMKIENMNQDPEEESGEITPKDILTTVSSIGEQVLNKVWNKPAIPQQTVQRVVPIQQVQNQEPTVVGPQTQRQITQTPESTKLGGQDLFIPQIPEPMRQTLTESISIGESGAEFGNYLIENTDIPESLVPVIKSYATKDLANIIGPYLSQSVGDELAKTLTGTPEGQKYLMEALEHIKNNL